MSKKYLFQTSLFAFFFLLILPSLRVNAQETEISVLLENISQRLKSYPARENWDAHVKTKMIRLDKNWQPKKTTIVDKIVTVNGAVKEEKILAAQEEEKGRIKDVTKKMQKDAAKAAEKSRENARKGKKHDERRLELGEEKLFPFGEKQRGFYEFKLLDEQDLRDTAVYVVQSRSFRKSRDYYEGLYYIAKDTFDILKVVLHPAKFSGPLKKLEMKVEFDLTPGGYFVVIKTWAKLHIGLIIKNIRIEMEEIYSDYSIK